MTQSHEFFIQCHLTERCNLDCCHCYQTGQKTDEMSLSEIGDIAREVSDMIEHWSETYGLTFSSSFNVTGGEPFMRRDIFGILEEIAKHGFEIYLLTNGILVDRDRARMLSAVGVKGVQVSIEGPEAVHDSIRGKGSFSSALKGVQYLLDAGLVVTLNTTLSAINADSFLQMVELCSSQGVQKLGFSRLVPFGRGKEMLESMLDASRVKELYQSIYSAEAEGVMLVTGDPVASQMSAQVDGDEGSTPCGGCAAGLSGLTILSDGTITPCRRLPIPIGNVREDSLREVWATSPVLSALRDRSRYKGKCGTCKRWAQYRGCRAIAYGYSQSHGNADFLAEDPQCFL